MRTVSYVDHLKLSYNGNLSAKAVALGDIDNDKGNELAVGNIDGEVYIYKGSESRARWKACDLGMITCLEIGDICNHGVNYLVTLSAAGWCYLFFIKTENCTSASVQGDGESDEFRCLKPVYRQQLAANSKTVLVADVDGDGVCELVIGYSDRRVRSYRWKEVGDFLSTPDITPGTPNGKFVAVENWQLDGQIGSMTINHRIDGSLDLMVSQPGGTFVTLLATDSHTSRKTEDRQEAVEVPRKHLRRQIFHHPLGSARARNTGVTTEVVGGISRSRHGADKHTPCFSAICTLDGTLTLVDTSEEEDKILWSLYVDHQLFSLNKLDVTGNGTEEVVACSWDGQTYIVNLNREVVRFQFGDNVAAFCAGNYAAEGNENVPCLIYVNFDNDICVYYRIHMADIGITNLLKKMEEKETVQPLLECLNCEASNQNEMKQLYHWCLYGKHS